MWESPIGRRVKVGSPWYLISRVSVCRGPHLLYGLTALLLRSLGLVGKFTYAASTGSVGPIGGSSMPNSFSKP